MDDWEAYEAERKAKHRENIARAMRSLESEARLQNAQSDYFAGRITREQLEVIRAEFWKVQREFHGMPLLPRMLVDPNCPSLY